VADGATSRGPRSAPAASAFGGETGWGGIDRNQKLHRDLKNGNKSAERRINFHFNILPFFSPSFRNCMVLFSTGKFKLNDFHGC